MFLLSETLTGERASQGRRAGLAAVRTLLSVRSLVCGVRPIVGQGLKCRMDKGILWA